MAFQPFGYRFEIASPMPPANAKAAIRSRKKGWFDSKNGARGWFVGPYICLWNSAFDRYGPMLFGRVARDSFGTRISGRAGSDLNGLALYLLLVPLLAFFLYQMIISGEATGNQILVIGGLVLLTPLLLWWSHKDRREAEPLVRFLKDALSANALGQAEAKRIRFAREFEMNVSGDRAASPITGDSIYDALLATGISDFVILASEPEIYIQTLGAEAGFVIEKREGDPNHHFRAIRRDGTQFPNPDGASHFSFEETWEALAAYVSESPMPTFIDWEPMTVGTDVYAAE